MSSIANRNASQKCWLWGWNQPDEGTIRAFVEAREDGSEEMSYPCGARYPELRSFKTFEVLNSAADRRDATYIWEATKKQIENAIVVVALAIWCQAPIDLSPSR
jgi:hypothetical protein